LVQQINNIQFIIIDEVHERDVFTDINIVLIKGLLKQNSDTRLILMSASKIDYNTYFKDFSFATHEIIVNNFPVTMYYLPDIMKLIFSNQ